MLLSRKQETKVVVTVIVILEPLIDLAGVMIPGSW